MVYQATPIKRDIEFPRTIADVYKKIKEKDGNFDCLEVEGITYNEKTKQICVTAFIAGDNRIRPTDIYFPFGEALELLRGKEIYEYDSYCQGAVFCFDHNLGMNKRTETPHITTQDYADFFADYFGDGVLNTDTLLEGMYNYLKHEFNF